MAGVPEHTPEMAKHQLDALEELEDGNILWGGVGAGKSRVAVAYYAMTEQHEDLYIITTAKKRDSLDWQKECARFAIGTERDATFHGTVVVDSWNNLDKYKEVKDAFFIFDEQRLVGSGTWTKAFLKIAKSNRWILLTATPGDTWLDYVPVFVANGFYKNRTQFKRDHVVYNTFTKFPKVDRYIGEQKLERLRKQILVPMRYKGEAERIYDTIKVAHDNMAMRRVMKDRWHVYEQRPLKDVGEYFRVMRMVCNTDPSRFEECLSLLDKHDKLVIFYNFDYELAILRALSAHVTVAEWNGHKHQEIPKTDKWAYLVQYTAGSEGWNCTETNAMCFWSLTYSYKQWEQAHGRIDRMDTPFAKLFYYTLLSSAWIDVAIRRSLREKKSFQEGAHVRMW